MKSTPVQNLLETFQYTLRESSRSKGQFFVGCSSVFLVVFTVSLMLTIIGIAPVIFLKLAESTNGEVDLILSNIPSSGSLRLNYTRIKNILENTGIQKYTYSSPRFYDWGATVYQCPTTLRFPNSTFTGEGTSYWAYCKPGSTVCIDYVCSRLSGASLNVIDTDQESFINLGRTW